MGKITSLTYGRNVIPEYWVIDLQNNQVIVHAQPTDSKYLQVVTYQAGVISPLAFPDIEISLNRLLLF